MCLGIFSSVEEASQARKMQKLARNNVIVQRGYKTELYLNNKQTTACLKHAGTARYAYNWGLNQKKIAINNKTKIPNLFELQRCLTTLKQTELSWMYEVSKCSPQEALRNLDKAFDNFFKKRSKFPKFKSKKNGIGSFKFTGTIKVEDGFIQLPRLGKLKLKEKGYLPTTSKILSATISERAGRWFVSIQVEQEQPKFTSQKDNHDVVGVDLGVKTLATVSDGQTFDNPKPLKTRLRKLRKLNKSVSRKVKGSQNRKKAVNNLSKLHYKISNIRKDTLHKITTILAKTKRIIGIEDLNISGMMKNRCLSRTIADLGLFEWRRQLEYKGKWYNCLIKVIDRWFPSSKTCHVCNKINDNLTLADREWTCTCGVHHDRDFNASKNIEHVAHSL
jgi:putative transposase